MIVPVIDCPICLDIIKPDDMHTLSCCNKTFHDNCISEWKILMLNDGSDAKCPCCRSILAPASPTSREEVTRFISTTPVINEERLVRESIRRFNRDQTRVLYIRIGFVVSLLIVFLIAILTENVVMTVSIMLILFVIYCITKDHI